MEYRVRLLTVWLYNSGRLSSRAKSPNVDVDVDDNGMKSMQLVTKKFDGDLNKATSHSSVG